MTLEIRTGNPGIEGVYVVYTIGLSGYTERELVMWHKGAWHYRFSTEPFRDVVFGWIGPLPDNFKMQAPPEPTRHFVGEYDL